jgi:Protein of unknown function (DUF3662)/FHA domain
MGLQSFERGVERMVDGVFTRAFKGSVRPIELGRRLVREMDEHRSVDVKGRRIVPNHFTFWLSPNDHAAFADIDEALVVELGEAAREYARDESYHFMGPVMVELAVDNKLKPGRFSVTSQMKESGGGVTAGSLVQADGTRVPLGGKVAVLGRMPDCAVIVTDANVSRRHAEVRPVGTGFVVADLGSTNGTKVNGALIDGERPLRDGDVISLGTTHLRFEAS